MNIVIDVMKKLNLRNIVVISFGFKLKVFVVFLEILFFVFVIWDYIKC